MEGDTKLGRGSRAVTRSQQVSADSTGTSEADIPFKVVPSCSERDRSLRPHVHVTGYGPPGKEGLTLAKDGLLSSGT